MLILLSPAKTMRRSIDAPSCLAMSTEPRLMEQTHVLRKHMLAQTEDELALTFQISPTLATQLHGYFRAQMSSDRQALAAIDAYDGVVFKHLKADHRLDEHAYHYLQRHARISSLYYGLLRPLDAIEPYRMEGYVKLPDTGLRVDRYWRDHQTQLLIDDVREAGGVLIYLASKEEQQAYHWSMVKKSVRVIDIQFLKRKAGKLKQVVVYTKMARGEMMRWLLETQHTSIVDLPQFKWGGYRYNAELSTEDTWVWVCEE